MSKKPTQRRRPRPKALVEIVCEEQSLTELRPSAAEMLRLFRRWLRANLSRFRFIPIHVGMAANDKDGDALFRFRGVCDQISFTVGPQGIRTHFDLAGEYFDTWNDFEVYPARTNKGQFVCVMCLIALRENVPERKRSAREFASLFDLYTDHCFEKILSWAKKHIRHGNVIIYEGGIEEKGFRAAYVRPLRHVLRAQEPTLVLPVIPNKQKKGTRVELALY